MIDDPTQSLSDQETGSRLLPAEPAAPAGETASLSGAGDSIAAGGSLPPHEAAPHAVLQISSRRIQGRKLGPYELLGLLGRGGMGAVYGGLDTRLNRRVAVKVMLAGEECGANWHSHATQEERERFRREAAHAAKLRHPNIVPVHDVGYAEGREYLVMDLVEGVTLGTALRQRHFTYREKAALLEKVARAVQHAHEQGVIHRDLKPGNIMLDFGHEGSSSVAGRPAGSPGEPGAPPTATGEPLVMDFGLAKDIQHDSAPSRAGQALGTPAYMAPEQAEGKRHLVGPRSDVYSLGAILYELLAGRAPFTGETPLQVMRAAISDEPVPPRVVTPGVPRDLETICLKCLEKKPEQRYPSAAALADDLRAFVNDDPISARPLSIFERAARRVRKNPAPYVVGALAAVLLIASTALYIRSLDRKRREAEQALAQYREAQAAKEKAERERLALEAEKKREWQLVFEDDFSDPRKTAENWDITSEGGKWEIKDHELHVWGGTEHMAVFKMPMTGDIRVQFECRQEGDFLNDVTCGMRGTLQEGDSNPSAKFHPLSGYLFQYGGKSNRQNALWRGVQTLWQERASPIVSGQRYVACAEIVGNHLRYTVNDRLVFDVTDPDPLGGLGKTAVCLYGCNANTCWDNVKVYRLGEPQSPDLLHVAERNLQRGQAETARLLLAEILASTNDPIRRVAATEALKKADALAELQHRLPEWQARIQRTWPAGKIRLAGNTLSVDISECGVSDLSPLQGMPITELQCGGNEIRTLEPLRGMKLTYLDCNHNRLDSLEPLRGMQLTRLQCSRNGLTTLEPLRGMKLTFLSCCVNGLDSLEAIGGMPLQKLYCDHNQLTNLEPLHGMPLNSLGISWNRIASLEPLRGMELHDLDCTGNKLTSLAPTKGMPLSYLCCANNLLTVLDPWVEKPPEVLYFACDTLPIAELERAGEIWARDARYTSHARNVGIILALRRMDKTALRAQAASFQGHRYLCCPVLRIWPEAKALCEQLGGHLVTISCAEENTFVASLLHGEDRWIGLRWQGGCFIWVTNEALLFDATNPRWDEKRDGPCGLLTTSGQWGTADGTSPFPSVIEGMSSRCVRRAHARLGEYRGRAERHNLWGAILIFRLWPEGV